MLLFILFAFKLQTPYKLLGDLGKVIQKSGDFDIA